MSHSTNEIVLSLSLDVFFAFHLTDGFLMLGRNGHLVSDDFLYVDPAGLENRLLRVTEWRGVLSLVTIIYRLQSLLTDPK
jgi:hypothetical protein